MPRKRLRPDFLRRNYTFDCQLLNPIPQILWDTAHAMNTLWNGLVAQHDVLLEPWDTETPKDVRRAGYEQFWTEAYIYIRDEGDSLALSCWPKWHVFDTFKIAVQ